MLIVPEDPDCETIRVPVLKVYDGDGFAREDGGQRRQHGLIREPLRQHDLAIIAQDAEPGCHSPDHPVPPFIDIRSGQVENIAAFARWRFAAGQRNRLQQIVGIEAKISDDRMVALGLVPQCAQIDVLRPETMR